MGEFASKGVAGAALGTGIAGLGLGVLNGAGGLFNGLWGNRGMCGNYGYSNVPFDMSVSEALAQRDAQIARLESKAYSDESDLAIYKYFEGKINALNEKFQAFELKQCEFNSTVTSGFDTLTAQVRSLQSLIGSITKTAIPQSVVCDFSSCNSTNCVVQSV